MQSKRENNKNNSDHPLNMTTYFGELMNRMNATHCLLGGKRVVDEVLKCEARSESQKCCLQCLDLIKDMFAVMVTGLVFTGMFQVCSCIVKFREVFLPVVWVKTFIVLFEHPDSIIASGYIVSVNSPKRIILSIGNIVSRDNLMLLIIMSYHVSLYL